ncbi:hypothetical protein [Nocardia sp. N2S4-5]|uniref:hypothetical protein n=1 Tax=Nocardia sp. N2S4-5 TaxID=3351565 RepID=UPI0037D69F0F
MSNPPTPLSHRVTPYAGPAATAPAGAILEAAERRIRDAYAVIVQTTRPGPVSIRELRYRATVSWEDFNRAIKRMDRQGDIDVSAVANHRSITFDPDATVLLRGNYWQALVIPGRVLPISSDSISSVPR